MQSHWKLFSVLTLFSFVSLFADDHEERIQKLEQHTYKTSEKHVTGMTGSKLSTARGCPEREAFFTTLDFIYWRGQNEGFLLGFNEQLPVSALGLATLIGDLIRIDPSWKPGFKFGIGWNAEYDDWDVLGRWTYYHNHSTESITVPAGDEIGILLPFWGFDGIGQNYAFTRGSWRLNHNMIDLEWGRSFFISRYLSLRPHAGLRGGWLYQRFRVRYEDPGVAAPQTFQIIFTGYNNFRGIGPRIGMDGNWFLGSWGFSVFGNIAAAILYGRMQTVEKERTLANASATPGFFIENVNISDKFYQLSPNLQLMLGLAWQRCFNNWFFFNLSAAWETNYWWDQFHLIAKWGNAAVLTFDLNKPIMLEGLTLRAKFDF